MSSAVAHALPPSILALFAPRKPVVYKTPLEKRRMPPLKGMAEFVERAGFEHPDDTPKASKVETITERRARVRELKAAANREKLEEKRATFDPSSDELLKDTDPYKTLFVARMSYETTEATLRKAFEQFGPVKSTRVVVVTTSKKSRGYGFVEFEHERDMKTAYKQGDGKKIDGRRVLVDVERGRTVRDWKPRRLGGGLGSTRMGKSNARGPQAMHPLANSYGSGGGGGGGGGGYDRASRPTPSSSGPSSSGGGPPSFSWSTETRQDRGREDRGRDDRQRSDRSGLGFGRGDDDRRRSSGGAGYDDRRRDDDRDRRRDDRDDDRRRDDDRDRRREDRGGDRQEDRSRDDRERDRDRDRRRDDDRDKDRDRDRDRRRGDDERDKDRDRDRRDRERERERERDRDRDRDRSSLKPPPPPPMAPPPPPGAPEANGAEANGSA